MRSVSISVTEASRNFADCINRSRYQGTTFILHKNGVAVARIVPERNSQKEEGMAGEAAKPSGRAEEVELQRREEGIEPPKKVREIW